MRITQLSSLAALASVGQAFLIPPAITTSDTKIVESVSFELTAALENRNLEVECPGCPVAGAAGVLHHAQSMLAFNVSIEHVDAQPDLLMVNGLQLFPVEAEAAAKLLTADQYVKKPDGTWGYSSAPQLGYSMRIKPVRDGEHILNLYRIHLRIIEVGNTFVRGIPSIEMKIIKTPTGKLMIASAQVGGGRSAKTHEPQCPSLLCHWKAAIANKVDSLKKGCGSKKGGHRGSRPYHVAGKRPDGPHRSHHHRRPHHGAFVRFLRSITIHVFMPVLIGITLGITASLVGMIVGHIAIFFWRLFFRRGERGQYCRVKQEQAVEDAVDETDEEGKGFLENQGPPPVYEDAVVVDEKTEQN